MANFYKLSYKDKLKRTATCFPIGLLCVLFLHIVLKIPLWIVLAFVAIGIIQLVYYYIKAQAEK